jgi:drug/metabolite transporter (DMT)-like permease
MPTLMASSRQGVRGRSLKIQTVLALILGILFLQVPLSLQIIIGFILVFGTVIVIETGSAMIEKEAGSESQPD